jgi:hypothetical protein
MKRLFLLSFIAAAGACGLAQAASPVEKAIDAALGCRSIADNTERLACFDGAMSGIDSARTEHAAETAAKKAAKEKKKKDDFGLKGREVVVLDNTEENFGGEAVPEVRAAQEAKRLKSIAATATSIKVNSLKQATLTLDNGQVWKQLESDNVSLPPMREGKSYAVTIKRGTMGNYMAVIEDLNRSIRVTRIK